MEYVDSKGIRFNSFDSNVLARIKKIGNDHYDHVTI